MNYSAGMVSQVFAFVETKKTAELMMTGMSKDEIKNRVVSENLYQLRNETRLRRTFNKLFFEFVYEVYRGKVILGEKTIDDRDINGFFDDKAAQSEEVAGWSESGIKKLKNCYMKNLADAGLIESTKTRVIRRALVNYRIEELLNNNGMDAYINAIKGA